MKKTCLFAVLCLAILASLCSTAVADIPSDVDYHAVYNKDDFTWSLSTDLFGFGVPEWQVEYLRLRIPNQEVQGAWKDVWVESIYLGLLPGQLQPFDSHSIVWGLGDTIFFEQTTRFDGMYSYSTWHWRCWGQPSYEWLVFANSSWFQKWYGYTETNLVGIEIGSKCTVIPEPSSLFALAGMMGGVGGLLLRRRK